MTVLLGFLMTMIFPFANQEAQAVLLAPAGSGTAADPYIIDQTSDLVWMSTHPSSWSDKYFVQTADLDFTGVASFTPIGDPGSYSTWFNGTYDGRWYTISNLSINTTECLGLFSHNNSSGTIKNLTLQDATVSGSNIVGSVVGLNMGLVENCHVIGSSAIAGTSNSMVGGIAGWNDGTISHCSNAASVSMEGAANPGRLGGVVGFNNYSSPGGIITNCFNTGSVTCTGTPNNQNYIGGIAGECTNAVSRITKCYAAGAITAPSPALGGGIAGKAISENCSSNFYLSSSAAQGIGLLAGIETPGPSDEGAVSTTDTNFKLASTFTDAGWDFTDVWKMVTDGYPVFITTPGSPTGLTATAANHSAVLSWTAGNRTGWYEVYLTASGDYTDPPIKVHTTTYTETGLSNDVRYDFVVRACNSSDDYADSEEISVRPEFMVTDLAATAGTEEVSFTFSPATDATEVAIYQSTNGVEYTPSTLTEPLDNTSTSATAINLNGMQRYYFKLVMTVGSYDILSNVVTAMPLPPTSTSGDLASISITDQTLNETFDPAVTSYTVDVASTVDTVTVSATANDHNSLIAVNGNLLTLGSWAADIDLTYGDNPIFIVVNPNNTDSLKKTYTVIVTRDKPADVTIIDASKSVQGTGLDWDSVWVGYWNGSSETAAMGFDLSSYTETIQKATLKVYVDNGNAYIFTRFKIYGTDEDDWGTTGKYLPAGMDATPLYTVSNDLICGWQIYDVTDYVKNHIADKDSQVSFFFDGVDTGENADIGINTNYATAYKPALELTPTTTSATVPAAPTAVSAVAGNGRATIYFTAPSDNGGSAVTGYKVTSDPGAITATGTGSPITVTGLTNGTSYTFTVQAENAVGYGTASAASGAVMHNNSGAGGGGGATAAPPSPAYITVNGLSLNAGTLTTGRRGNQTVTTVNIDGGKVGPLLGPAAYGATAVIPFSADADVLRASVDGQTVMGMEMLAMTMQMKGGNVIYTLPPALTNIQQIISTLGSQVALKDIKVDISMGSPPDNTVKVIQDTANRNNYQIVVKPVEFEISCTYGGQTIQVSSFTMYVERMVAIPSGIDPSRITTGVVQNSDGTFSHVPTTIVAIDGKYYARINSLTNSAYAVIYNPQTFTDMANHWAKTDVNDMGSRLIVNGVGSGKFAPDRPITRAEFASIIVKGLGLMRTGTGKASFSDVKGTDWYFDAVSIAKENNLISGYKDGSFLPEQTITREEAMAIMTKAMQITKLDTALSAADIDQQLAAFSDRGSISKWAESGAAACIKSGIVVGSDGNIEPGKAVTRAQVAVMVRKVLQKAKLI